MLKHQKVMVSLQLQEHNRPKNIIYVHLNIDRSTKDMEECAMVKVDATTTELAVLNEAGCFENVHQAFATSAVIHHDGAG